MVILPDRVRVYNTILDVPLPYLLAYVRTNYDDVKLWRLIDACEMDEYLIKAVLAFGIKPTQLKIKHPKKSKEEIVPRLFSPRDKYWRRLIEISPKIANEVRDQETKLPTGMRKKKQVVRGFF